MLTDKQIKKFTPILNNFICGHNGDFYTAIRKLTKLEIVLILTQTHQVIFLGKTKQIDLEDKVIYALQSK